MARVLRFSNSLSKRYASSTVVDQNDNFIAKKKAANLNSLFSSSSKWITSGQNAGNILRKVKNFFLVY